MHVLAQLSSVCMQVRFVKCICKYTSYGFFAAGYKLGLCLTFTVAIA